MLSELLEAVLGGKGAAELAVELRGASVGVLGVLGVATGFFFILIIACASA